MKIAYNVKLIFEHVFCKCVNIILSTEEQLKQRLRKENEERDVQETTTT